MQGLNIMMTLFDDEYILEAYTKEREDNAALREARETAIRLFKKGKMSFEDIADCVPTLSLDELKQIEAEVMQLA